MIELRKVKVVVAFVEEVVDEEDGKEEKFAAFVWRAGRRDCESSELVSSTSDRRAAS